MDTTKSKKIEVEVQENGLIRNRGGFLIGKLRKGVSFETDINNWVVVEFLNHVARRINPDSYNTIYEILEWHYPEEVKRHDEILEDRLKDIKISID